MEYIYVYLYEQHKDYKSVPEDSVLLVVLFLLEQET